MTDPRLKGKFKVPTRGIPLKAFEDMTIAEVRKLDMDYRRLIKGGSRKI